MRFAIFAVAAIALSGCAHNPLAITKDTINTASVPVMVACAGKRPVAVTPLKDRYTQQAWGALTVKQKAAIVGSQALKHQNYGQQLNAATGACP